MMKKSDKMLSHWEDPSYHTFNRIKCDWKESSVICEATEYFSWKDKYKGLKFGIMQNETGEEENECVWMGVRNKLLRWIVAKIGRVQCKSVPDLMILVPSRNGRCN